MRREGRLSLELYDHQRPERNCQILGEMVNEIALRSEERSGKQTLGQKELRSKLIESEKGDGVK